MEEKKPVKTGAQDREKANIEGHVTTLWFAYLRNAFKAGADDVIVWIRIGSAGSTGSSGLATTSFNTFLNWTRIGEIFFGNLLMPLDRWLSALGLLKLGYFESNILC